MRTSIASLLAALSVLSISSAAGTIRMDIVKNRHVEAAQLLGKRGTITSTLGNAAQLGLYFANVTVGTPPQAVALQIDTGSSDIWVPSATARFCTSEANACYGGTFATSKSSTFAVIQQNEFNISYVDGTGASGDYFQDTFSIAGSAISRMQMGLASKTTIPVGIMGIGYANSEANVFTGNGTSYPNLADMMVAQGLIPTQAYSLWLDDLHSSTGSILFGGIDTKKFIGNLESVMVYPSSRGRNVTSFTVAFTSLSATSSSGTDTLSPAGMAVAAILDSGTTLTLLPDSLAKLVFAELGATVDNQLGATVVPCSLANNTGTLNFGFGGVGGPVINVPVNELVLPLTLTNGKSPTYPNGQTACQLGIQAAGNLPILFGDTFLRSAYVVYDLQNNRIALAQTNFNATDSNVVPFPSKGAAIPSAATATGEAAVTQTNTAIPKVASTGASGAATITGAGAGSTGLSAANGFTKNSAAGRVELCGSYATVVLAPIAALMFVGGMVVG